ncbi:hypothetical protein HDV01_003253 [Terramyces sp. JEL0728]|nr:hypothetical protein HDV01_003253 [Terramyces sp. JEL0728]
MAVKSKRFMLPYDLLLSTALYLDLKTYYQFLYSCKSNLPLVPELNPNQFFNSTSNQEFKHSMKINLAGIRDYNRLCIDLLEADQIYELISLQITNKLEIMDIAIPRQVQLFFIIQMQYKGLELQTKLQLFHQAYFHLFEYLLLDIQPTNTLFLSVCLTGNYKAVQLMIDRVKVTDKAIMNAVRFGHVRVFRLLLNRIDPSFDDNKLLKTAVLCGQYSIVETLINDERVKVDEQVAVQNKHYKAASLIMNA